MFRGLGFWIGFSNFGFGRVSGPGFRVYDGAVALIGAWPPA